jgi:hypothetical protein
MFSLLEMKEKRPPKISINYENKHGEINPLNGEVPTRLGGDTVNVDTIILSGTVPPYKFKWDYEK